MKYISAICILLSLIFILSFAKHNLKNNKKRAAAGAIVLAALTVAVPILVMLME